ncbi:hypothetical protein PMIN06_002631 [Paraphaeosphaeria minitans]
MTQRASSTKPSSQAPRSLCTNCRVGIASSPPTPFPTQHTLLDPFFLSSTAQPFQFFAPPSHHSPTLRLNTWTVCAALRPFSFSSRLTRVAAAASPMDTAKMGSRELQRRGTDQRLLAAREKAREGGTDREIMYW